MERWAQNAERWVEEFTEFIRDHRSQDPVVLYVNRVYREECSHCGSEWEDPPFCCNKAVEEYDAQQTRDDIDMAKADMESRGER